MQVTNHIDHGAARKWHTKRLENDVDPICSDEMNLKFENRIRTTQSTFIAIFTTIQNIDIFSNKIR